MKPSVETNLFRQKMMIGFTCVLQNKKNTRRNFNAVSVVHVKRHLVEKLDNGREGEREREHALDMREKK